MVLSEHLHGRVVTVLSTDHPQSEFDHDGGAKEDVDEQIGLEVDFGRVDKLLCTFHDDLYANEKGQEQRGKGWGEGSEESRRRRGE